MRAETRRSEQFSIVRLNGPLKPKTGNEKQKGRTSVKKKKKNEFRCEMINTTRRRCFSPFSDKGRHILDHFCMYTPINNKGIVENNLLFIKRKKRSIDFHFQRCKIFEKIII